MSAVEAATHPTAANLPALRRISTRFFRSELLLIFGRRRNWAGMAVLAAVPLIIAIAVKVTAPRPGGGGPDFLSSITSNGLFVALAALAVELPLFLPLAVSAIAGDAVAGEANLGTLRNLLAVPVHRTRLLAVKYAAIVVFAVAATALIAAVGALAGLVLFGGGPLTLLSGVQVPFGTGLVRLVLVCGYIAACLAALGAVGLFVSTLTEQPIGATIATLIFAITSHILDAIPQLDWLHPYLISHYWMAFGDLLRSPIATTSIWPGLGSAAAYTLIFLAAAWARFSSRDITS
ncbi:ABC transporter permease [Actinopolymorpha alba]|uniref:ABC transporter permease n=1 Tax=Actinopolymorpha alba TaxID=533267 RepID=UPI00035EC2C2|nr:ABC transporter permease [Actinopolymorpha alba]